MYNNNSCGVSLLYIARVVNNTFWKYWQYQYQYLVKKVLPIPIPILFEQYFFYHIYTYTYVSPVYFVSQQKKSKPWIFSLNHNGEITLLPNENSVPAAAVHSLTERMNNIISKCSLLSLDHSENSLSTAALAGNRVFSSMYSVLMSG